MKFQDEYFSKEHRYSLGIEQSTGKRYISIPVSNSRVDYEEYYEVDAETYEVLLKDSRKAIDLADQCRQQKNDEKLIIKPGTERGSS